MKKTYMQPSVEVVKVEQEVMLSESDFENALGTNGVSGDAALAGDRYDFDDDDDLGSIIPW